MLNATVAELITTTIAGETVRGEVVEIRDFTLDSDRKIVVDVVLKNGRLVKGADTLDIFPHFASPILDAA